MTGSAASENLPRVKVLVARIRARLGALAADNIPAPLPRPSVGEPGAPLPAEQLLVEQLLAEQLLAERAALRDFIVAMEAEFLELGQLLRKIAALAREVRDRSGEVMATASGHAEDAAIQFAFQLLKKAEDLVTASGEQHANVFQVFEKIQNGLALVVRERNRLIRTLAPLESTNTQYRIQACPFDQDTRARFFALAESVGCIVRDTKEAVGQRFDDLERMGKTTGELVANLSATAGRQKLETETLLARTRANLSELNGALLNSEMESREVSQVGVRIAAGVGKAIVALQCQDMARQKFEHIGAAIDGIVAQLHAGPGGAGSEFGSFLAGAGRVQLGQLHAVFDQLNGAAGGLETGLRELRSEATAFAEYSLRSGGAALDGQVIGRAIESIHGVLEVIDSAIGGVESIAGIVGNLKRTFGDCTSEILSLALRLKMTALNAQIFAARVDEGGALEVVAQNTRAVADEAMDKLDLISGHVAGLVDLVIDLEQRIVDYRDLADVERNLLGGEAGEAETKLLALDGELRAAVAAVGPLEEQLSEAVCQAAARIRFPGEVAKARARSTALFERIVNDYSNSNVPEEGLARERLESLKNNYTMAHERQVHEAAMETAGRSIQSPTDAEPEISDGGTDESIADNIELF